MKFEETKNPEAPYRVTFERKEIQVVLGVVAEAVIELARREESDSFPIAQWGLSDWKPPTNGNYNRLKPRSIHIKDPYELAKLFKGFHEDTSSAVVKFDEESEEAPFSNHGLIVRHELGEIALRLAEQLSEEAIGRMGDSVDYGLSQLLDRDQRG